MRLGGRIRTAILAVSGLAVLSACGQKTETAETAPPPLAPAEPAPAPAPPAEPLLVGSQDARDDLYCSGLIYAVHKANAHDSLSDAADKRRADVIKLAEAGLAKLKSEGVATDSTTAFIADAHSAQASKDLDTASLRIPYETCVARADAVKAVP